MHRTQLNPMQRKPKLKQYNNNNNNKKKQHIQLSRMSIVDDDFKCSSTYTHSRKSGWNLIVECVVRAYEMLCCSLCVSIVNGFLSIDFYCLDSCCAQRICSNYTHTLIHTSAFILALLSLSLSISSICLSIFLLSLSLALFILEIINSFVRYTVTFFFCVPHSLALALHGFSSVEPV